MSTTRADFFLDAQNLFYRVKAVFGYTHPNFDVVKLCGAIAHHKGLEVGNIHFYTGMPSAIEDPHWHDYWSRRLKDLGQQGVKIFSPPLSYRKERTIAADGTPKTVHTRQEKGVDIRIALDMVRAVNAGVNAMVIISRDNDLAVAVDEVRDIAFQQGRSLHLINAYPHGLTPTRGLENTEWFAMGKGFYDGVIDHRDYRSSSMKQNHETRERVERALADPRLLNQQPRLLPLAAQEAMLRHQAPRDLQTSPPVRSADSTRDANTDAMREPAVLACTSSLELAQVRQDALQRATMAREAIQSIALRPLPRRNTWNSPGN